MKTYWVDIARSTDYSLCFIENKNGKPDGKNTIFASDAPGEIVGFCSSKNMSKEMQQQKTRELIEATWSRVYEISQYVEKIKERQQKENNNDEGMALA